MRYEHMEGYVKYHDVLKLQALHSKVHSKF